MVKSRIHEQIEAIAQDRGAMCLSASLIHSVVLDSLLRAISFGRNAPVLFPTGHKAVVVNSTPYRWIRTPYRPTFRRGPTASSFVSDRSSP
jgi:hypothetical protein